MKKYLFFTLLAFAQLLLWSSCGKKCQDISDPKCENYDPCYRKISADFKMGVLVEGYSGNRYFEVDTTHKPEQVLFEALDSSNVSYEWKIGTDQTTWTDRKLSLFFQDSASVDVRLIVRKKDACAMPPIADTVTKRLVVRNSNFRTFFKGKYRGYLESNPSDVFVITILADSQGFEYMDGIPRGCEKHFPNDWDVTRLYFGVYRDFEFGDALAKPNPPAPCVGIYGWGRLAQDDATLTLDFQQFNTAQQKYVKDKFIGKKIQ